MVLSRDVESAELFVIGKYTTIIEVAKAVNNFIIVPFERWKVEFFVNANVKYIVTHRILRHDQKAIQFLCHVKLFAIKLSICIMEFVASSISIDSYAW